MNNLDLNSQRFILKYIKKDEVEQYKIVKKENIASTSEQIQEDIIAYMDACISANEINPQLGQTILEDACQIVVDNFKKLNDRDE